MTALNNVSWVQVGVASPASIMLQNTGHTIMGYVFAAAAPADGTLIGVGEHFKLYGIPSNPIIITGLNVSALNVYMRSFSNDQHTSDVVVHSTP